MRPIKYFSDLYVIGTAPDSLIYLYMNGNHIWAIQPGMQNVDPQSIICGLPNAMDVVDQIKENFDKIGKFPRSVFEASIGVSNDIDPNDIHIYKLGVIREVI